MTTKPLLGPCDSFQLEPFAYPWAWEMARECEQNTWTPEEIQVGADVALWKSNRLSESERHLFLSVMAQLTTFDIQRGDDAAETLLAMMQPAEIKHFCKRLVWEEAIHTRSYRYIIENLGLDLEIYDRWRTVPGMKARVEMAQKYSAPLLEILGSNYLRDDLLYDKSDRIDILNAMVFWFLVFEGTWFMMSLFGPIQAMARRDRMKGAAEQFQYIARDEVVHVRFGTQLIQEYIRQYPDSLSIHDIREIFARGLALEEDYIRYCMPEPMMGYNAEDHIETARWYADLRLKSIGLDPLFGAEHRFPWMAEMMNLRKEKNFFETRVTEYRTGGALQWED